MVHSPILQAKHKHTFKLHEICQFGQFIFGKIITIVATRYHLLKLKCAKFDFSWGSAGEAHSAPPDPQLDFRERTGGKEGRIGEGRKWVKRKEERGEGRKGKR